MGHKTLYFNGFSLHLNTFLKIHLLCRGLPAGCAPPSSLLQPPPLTCLLPTPLAAPSLTQLLSGCLWVHGKVTFFSEPYLTVHSTCLPCPLPLFWVLVPASFLHSSSRHTVIPRLCTLTSPAHGWNAGCVKAGTSSGSWPCNYGAQGTVTE